MSGAKNESRVRSLKSSFNFGPDFSVFDPERPIEIHTDALDVEVGVVPIPKHGDIEHAVANTSKALNKAPKNYGATELILLAVVNAIEKFHCYIGNQPFKIVTDHSAIGALLK